MRLSSIDIGSNTILLLIAEYDSKNLILKSILNEHRIPRISKNLKTNLVISNEKINEMWKVLKEYDDLINQYNVDVKLAVATNAFRTAKNGSELVKKINNEFNFEIKILSGKEEARLSFLGSIPYDTINKNYIVIDIGGGSTEIIYGSKEKVIFRESFNVGVVSLSENYIFHNPPRAEEIVSINNELEVVFNPLEKMKLNFEEIIAVAGTPTTLSCMLQGIKVYDKKSIDNSIITTKQIESINQILLKMNTAQIVDLYGEIVKGREDVLLSGSIILQILLKYLKKDYFVVNGNGLRYGVIIDYLKSNKLIDKNLTIL